MKLSTKARYGLRIMIDLAQAYQKELRSLQDLACEQQLTKKYLWQLLAKLKAAKLLDSKQGPLGGYFLLKNPAKIKIIDVLKVLEKPFFLVKCVKQPKLCPRAKQCSARRVWSKAENILERFFSSLNLAQVINSKNNDF